MITRWAHLAPPPAFAPAYVSLDERSFEALLGETLRFARFVRFEGGEGESAATWAELLGADPTMVLALLATLNVSGPEEALHAMIRAGRAEVDLARKEERLRTVLTAALALAAEIDGALASAQVGDRAEWQQVREMVAQTVHERLAPPLRAMVEIIAEAERAGWLSEALLPRVAHLHPIWAIRIDEAGPFREGRDGEGGWMDQALDELAILIESFLAGIDDLVRRSRALIETTLASHGHPPHVGLLMAFLRVYERFQRQLNAVPLRIADFYQREILHERPSPATPDSLYLASPLLALAGGPQRVTVRFLDVDGVPGLDETALAGLVSRSVRLARSTPEGWADVAAPDVDCLLDTKASLAFSFKLDEAAAPMAVPAEPEAGAPSLPALRFTLSQAKCTVVDGEGRPIDIMPCRLLGVLVAGGVRIEVECDRLQGVSLSTPSGPVAADSGAIPLFGAQPLAGSWLRIDHPLLASGAVRRVQVNVDWAALPPDPTGFTGYYAQYVVGPERRVVDPAVEPLFTNDGFRVDMVAPFGTEGRRLRRARLFADAGGAQTALLPTSSFVIDAGTGEAAGEDPQAAILVLEAPPYGFGDDLYPANVAHAAGLHAPAAEGALLPNPPSHPLASAIRVGCRVSAEWPPSGAGAGAIQLFAGGAAAALPIPEGFLCQAPGVPGREAVEQPLPSSRGWAGESPEEVARRTAARLRHKDRAVLAWDVEQLALERFPEIGAIRVFAGRSPDGNAAPGSVTAVVLPRAPLPGEPPRVSPRLRGEVAQWLGRRSSPFARIAVVDPVCVPLDIVVRARFAGDPRDAERLEPELLAFLAPGSGALGLADRAGSAELRGRIAAFIRERDYVEGLERLSIAFADDAPSPPWFVPLPRRIDIAAIAFEDGEEE
jgi:hypothetical protein